MLCHKRSVGTSAILGEEPFMVSLVTLIDLATQVLTHDSLCFWSCQKCPPLFWCFCFNHQKRQGLKSWRIGVAGVRPRQIILRLSFTLYSADCSRKWRNLEMSNSPRNFITTNGFLTKRPRKPYQTTIQQRLRSLGPSRDMNPNCGNSRPIWTP